MKDYEAKADAMFEGRELCRPSQRQGPSAEEIARALSDAHRAGMVEAYEDAAKLLREWQGSDEDDGAIALMRTLDARAAASQEAAK